MELVSELDRHYVAHPVACPNEGNPAKLPASGVTHKAHGAMAVHGSGAFLVCGICDAKTATTMK